VVKTELEKRGDWIRNGWRRDPRAYVEAGNVWATRGGSACFSVGQLSEWSTMGLMAAAALATRLLVEPAEAADLVARAKGISMKTLEPGLDDRSLDSWLRERVWRGATMSWRGIECRTARGELGEAPSDIGDCVQVVVDAPPPPVHADRFRCQVALELKLPLQGTDRAPAVVWMASRLTRTEDWTRVQRLDDIASRVRACEKPWTGSCAFFAPKADDEGPSEQRESPGSASGRQDRTPSDEPQASGGDSRARCGGDSGRGLVPRLPPRLV